MDDPPYTTPEEDPFNVRPLFQNDLRQRRSSMFDKWIHEQQCYSSPCEPFAATIRGHSRSQSSPMNSAFLAYPELSRSSLDRTGAAEDAASESGYDLVEDNDIPPDLAASFLNMEVTDAPATIRASKRISRMSLSPTSFRHFNLVFRSPSSTEEAPSRPPPSSRISLFSRSNRNSTGTITSRGGTITPHSTPSKPSRRSSQISRPPHSSSLPYTPPLVARTSSASKWRPSVLGHFTSSPQPPSSTPPYQDTTNYTPSRPSVSSCSGDTSNAATSLTVPSTEGSHGPCQYSPTHSSPSGHSHRPHSRNGKHYSGSFANSCSTDTMSGASSMRSRACSSSVNTSGNIHDLFGPDNNNNRDFASPSPTLSAGTGRGHGAMSTLPRMYPFVYNNNGVQTNHRHRRGGGGGGGGGGSTFDGIPSSYNYRPRGQYTAANPDGEVDDDDELDNLSPLPTPTQQQHSEIAKKKKPHVVYASQNGTALSRMTSLSSIALSPVSRHRKKKKKLVISGIAMNDSRRFDAVKRWCESFGEVRQILRMPNGDLVVSFQSAEVADTVCRVRAKVFINGVGSVQLSWTTEKHR